MTDKALSEALQWVLACAGVEAPHLRVAVEKSASLRYKRAVSKLLLRVHWMYYLDAPHEELFPCLPLIDKPLLQLITLTNIIDVYSQMMKLLKLN